MTTSFDKENPINPLFTSGPKKPKILPYSEEERKKSENNYHPVRVKFEKSLKREALEFLVHELTSVAEILTEIRTTHKLTCRETLLPFRKNKILSSSTIMAQIENDTLQWLEIEVWLELSQG